MMKPIIWTIAGSDSCAAAGIQADLKTCQDFGVHACSVITAVTAQNTAAVSAIHYASPEMVSAQIEALKSAWPPKAIKLGMLGHAQTIRVIRDFLQTYAGYVILDPVMIASTGHALFSGDVPQYTELLKSLSPFVDLLTPNLPEAETLLGLSLTDPGAIQSAGQAFIDLGVQQVLIKGGHQSSTDCHDYWTNGRESAWLSSKRYPLANYSGTGCTLSASISALLALGYDIRDALVIAKMYVSQAIRLSQPHHVSALLAQGGWPGHQADLPSWSSSPRRYHQATSYPSVGERPIGLYPIVDSLDWIKRLHAQGVTTLQLRIKTGQMDDIDHQIKVSIDYAKNAGIRLFINDFWQSALSYGAYGVHLGQTDLDGADLEGLHAAGIRLGISTHTYQEVAKAHYYQPSYLACGPIFPTTSKSMPYQPQGVSQLKYWCQLLHEYRLVAIGGINEESMRVVKATGVDGVAMISAITLANDPERVTQDLLRYWGSDDAVSGGIGTRL